MFFCGSQCSCVADASLHVYLAKTVVRGLLMARMGGRSSVLSLACLFCHYLLVRASDSWCGQHLQLVQVVGRVGCMALPSCCASGNFPVYIQCTPGEVTIDDGRQH